MYASWYQFIYNIVIKLVVCVFHILHVFGTKPLWFIVYAKSYHYTSSILQL